MSSTSPDAEVPNITLNDGNEIPQLGFGVFQIPPEETAEAVAQALQIGYRHIDTAEMYGNEQGVADGLREAGIDRDEVFITSKLNNGYHEPADAHRAIEQTLEKLGTRHVDLFLIHWPLPTRYGGDFVQTWKAMESFKEQGYARSIGVSNFQTHHLDEISEQCDVTPAVNQIELHPYFVNHTVDHYGRELGIATEAWSPIAQAEVLDDETIASIAGDVGRTPAQVVLRWHLQRANIVFPKSVTPERMEENFQIFDFALSDEQMDAITELDKGEGGRTGPHPDRFAMIPD